MLGSQLADEMTGNQHPRQPQAGRQGLAGRAGVHDAVRRHALQRRDRIAVIAILSVVVVFDDQPTPPASPGDQAGATSGAQHRASGVLVGGRENHGIDVRRLELVEDQALGVDANRDNFKPRLHDSLGNPWPGRVFHRDPPSAALAQRVPEDAQTVRRPRADEYPFGLSDDRPHPPEVDRQCAAQLPQPTT